MISAWLGALTAENRIPAIALRIGPIFLNGTTSKKLFIVSSQKYADGGSFGPFVPVTALLHLR
jgi:hypothetical protein